MIEYKVKWEEIDDEYQYVAINNDGEVNAFSKEPLLDVFLKRWTVIRDTSVCFIGNSDIKTEDITKICKNIWERPIKKGKWGVDVTLTYNQPHNTITSNTASLFNWLQPYPTIVNNTAFITFNWGEDENKFKNITKIKEFYYGLLIGDDYDDNYRELINNILGHKKNVIRKRRAVGMTYLLSVIAIVEVIVEKKSVYYDSINCYLGEIFLDLVRQHVETINNNVFDIQYGRRDDNKRIDLHGLGNIELLSVSGRDLASKGDIVRNNDKTLFIFDETAFIDNKSKFFSYKSHTINNENTNTIVTSTVNSYDDLFFEIYFLSNGHNRIDIERPLTNKLRSAQADRMYSLDSCYNRYEDTLKIVLSGEEDLIGFINRMKKLNQDHSNETMQKIYDNIDILKTNYITRKDDYGFKIIW